MTETSTSLPTEAPEKATAMTKAVWPEFVKAYETMTSAAEAVAKVKGSAGEFLAKAKAEVIDSEEGAFVSAFAEAFAKMAAEGFAYLDELASQKAAEAMKDLTPRRVNAESKFTEASSDFDAALRMIGKDKACAKIIATVSRPALPKAARGKGTTSTKANTTGLRYWRQEKDGAKVNQPDSQNKASSLAYYFGGCLNTPETRYGKTEALEAYGATKGVNVKAAEPWSLVLPNGMTIGADKVGE